MLKKVVSTSQKLANLKSDSARLLYTWLIPHLDIEGRFSADPKIVKGYVVPRLKMSLRKISEYLEDMAKNDLIILYEADGDRYLQLRKFKDFQILRKKRESKSIIPPPAEESRITPGVSTEYSSTSKVKESKTKENTSCSEKVPEHAFKYSETHKNLAKLLEAKIKERMPRHKFTGKNYLEEWANEFRIMEEKKEATAEEIEMLIIWVSENDFWYKNIRSADKLRKQFGRLWAEMEDEAKKKGKRIETPEEFTRRQKEALGEK